MNKKVIVTGAAGYIGSDLVETLLNSGFKVVAIDRMYFGDTSLDLHFNNPNFELHRIDARGIPETVFEGAYAICDLVALSNDPSGELNPDLTYAVNNLSRVRTAKLARNVGVEKYILWSSCSVYGTGRERNLNEESNLNPLSSYSKASLAAEVGTLELANKDFSVTVLRNGTAFGLSRRMRFDLVVNLMVASAFESGKILVTGGGGQWRPLVHLHDISRAALSILGAPESIINKEVFNIGMENTQISTLAYRIRKVLDIPCEIQIVPDDSDKRDYHISFEKASRILNFQATTSIENGALEIYNALITGACTRDEVTSTLKWYKRLTEAENLFKKLNIDGTMF